MMVKVMDAARDAGINDLGNLRHPSLRRLERAIREALTTP